MRRWADAPKGVVEHLLTLGSRPRGSDPQGDTLLHAAVRRGDAALCRRLVALVGSSESSLSAVNAKGEAPLLLALVDGHLEIATALVQHGAVAVDCRATHTMLCSQCRQCSVHR